MSDYINASVPVADGELIGVHPHKDILYPWMSIKAGSPSYFSEVRMRGGIYDKNDVEIVGGGGGGGGVNRFVELLDVEAPPIPFLGQAVHYNGTKWTQTPHIKANPTTGKIDLETTGAVAIIGDGSVGIQSLASDVAIASLQNASLTSATGITSLTSLNNNIELTSQLNTNITSAIGDITLQSSLGNTLIYGTNQALLRANAGFAGLSSSSGTTITSDDGNINLLASNSAGRIYDIIGTTTILDKSATQIKTATGYEAFITDDECLINKKYLDSRIGASVSSYNYNVDTLATAPPTASGDIQYDNAVQISSTILYLSHRDGTNRDIEVLLGSYTIGTTLIIQDELVSGDYQKYTISATPIMTIGNNVAFPVTFVSSNGVGTTGFPNNHKVLVFFISGSGAGGGSDPTKWTKGGDVGIVGGNLLLGTTNDSDVTIIRNNFPVLSITNTNVALESPANVFIGTNGLVGNVNISAIDNIRITTYNEGIVFDVPNLPLGYLDITSVSTGGTPEMYSAKITGIPSAVPNVQYITDQIVENNNHVILVGGNNATGQLQFGTNNAEDVSIRRDSSPVFETIGLLTSVGQPVPTATTIIRADTSIINMTNDINLQSYGGSINLTSDVDSLWSCNGYLQLVSSSATTGVGIEAQQGVIVLQANGPTSYISLRTANLTRFIVESNGTLQAQTANYEILVTDPQDIPNKKYVDDKVAGVSAITQAIISEPYPSWRIGASITPATTAYYQNGTAMFTATASKMRFMLNSSGSDSIVLAVYRSNSSWDITTSTLVGMSALTSLVGYATDTIYTLPLIVQPGRSLAFTAGEGIILAVYINGTTNSLKGSTITSSPVAWANTNNLVGDVFPTNPQSKAVNSGTTPFLAITT